MQNLGQRQKTVFCWGQAVGRRCRVTEAVVESDSHDRDVETIAVRWAGGQTEFSQAKGKIWSVSLS